VTRFGDHACSESTHHRADGHRFGIIALIGDPAAHRGLHRQEVIADPDLTLAELLVRRLDDLEILRLRDTFGAADEEALAVHWASPMLRRAAE
jgi:hypothetical protein